MRHGGSGRWGKNYGVIHTIGLPVIDRIKAGDYPSADEVAAALGLDLNRPVILFIEHAIATEPSLATSQAAPVAEFEALWVQCVLCGPYVIPQDVAKCAPVRDCQFTAPKPERAD
jgi:hypothetical protein